LTTEGEAQELTMVEVWELANLLYRLRSVSIGKVIRLLSGNVRRGTSYRLKDHELDRLRRLLHLFAPRFSRKALLTMVYGAKAKPLIAALAHFRPPSAAKRRFIDEVLEEHRRRCPWANQSARPEHYAWKECTPQEYLTNPDRLVQLSGFREYCEDNSIDGPGLFFTNREEWKKAWSAWLSMERERIERLPKDGPPGMTLGRGQIEPTPRRRGWLTSRLLHVYAFHPNHYARTSEPLYRRRDLVAGGKRRVIHVPNQYLGAALRALHGVLARHYTPAIPDYVFGLAAPDGSSRTIFANAQRHAERALIASFDLRDFFPSVGVGELVRVFADLDGPLSGPKAADARVLVARLATHRGRLPQGSPTSPLLASLAFLRFDERIRERLGPKVTYTRYFDDITVSVDKRGVRDLTRRLQRASKGAGRTRRRGPGRPQRAYDVSTPRGFRRWAEAAIDEVLSGSSFQLHPRKSRAGSTTTTHGFEITGVTVSHERFGWPRRKRRQTRTACHLLATRGWVVAAEAIVPRQSVEGLREVASTRGVERIRVKGYSLPRRRWTLERLTLAATPALFGRLGATVWFKGEGDGSTPTKGEPLEGGLLERVLHDVFSGLTRTTVVGHEAVIRGFDESSEVRIAVDRNPSFFELEVTTAARVVLLAHKLSGLRAFLGSAPQGEAFSTFYDAARRVSDALERARVVSEGRRAILPGVGTTGPTITPHGVLREFVDVFLQARADFLRRFQLQADKVSAATRDRLAVAARDASEVGEWLMRLVEEFDRLPSVPDDRLASSRVWGGNHAWRQLGQCLQGERGLPYRFQLAGLQLDPGGVRERWKPASAQWSLLDAAARWLRSATSALVPSRGESTALDELTTTYETVVGLRGFRDGARREFAITCDKLRQPIKRTTESQGSAAPHDARWHAIGEAALQLYKVTWDAIDLAALEGAKDSLEPVSEDSEDRPPANQLKRKALGRDVYAAFSPIRDLRNQQAHVKGRDDVTKARRNLCKRLPHVALADGDPLEITDVEAEELREELIRIALKALEKLAGKLTARRSAESTATQTAQAS